MEELQDDFSDVRESYDEFLHRAVRAVNYAEEHPELEYYGSLDTVELSLQPEAAELRLEESLLEAQNQGLKVQNNIHRLTSEMMDYRDNQEDKPSEYYRLGEDFDYLKKNFHEIHREIETLAEEFEKTVKERGTGPSNISHGEVIAQTFSRITDYIPKRD